MAAQQKQESWTPEQQMQELRRRMGLAMSSMMILEKPDFKPEPDDIIVTIYASQEWCNMADAHLSPDTYEGTGA